MKYKPCCNLYCLMLNCETRENGGCACVCKIKIQENLLNGHINGTIFFINGASIYVAEHYREEFLSKLSYEQKEENKLYREEKAPKELEKVKKELKKYIVE